MPTPLSNRPQITRDAIQKGYVLRYFTRLKFDTKYIVEIDERQYNIFKSDTIYETIRLPWIINGNSYDSVSTDGANIQGAETQNTNIVEYYSKTMPTLNRYLPNKLEYFVGNRLRPSVQVGTSQ